MNIHLDHLSNCIEGPGISTAIRAILDRARVSRSTTPRRLPERTLAVRLPGKTVKWLRQQADAHNCAMAEIVRAHVANQMVSELTERYQQHTASPAEFSAELWSVLGYEPELTRQSVKSAGPSPAEEVHGRT